MLQETVHWCVSVLLTRISRLIDSQAKYKTQSATFRETVACVTMAKTKATWLANGLGEVS